MRLTEARRTLDCVVLFGTQTQELSAQNDLYQIEHFIQIKRNIEFVINGQAQRKSKVDDDHV